MDIQSEGESDTSTITINSTSGLISTIAETPIDSYMIRVRAVKDNDEYTNTVIYITVEEPPPAPPPAPSPAPSIAVPTGKGFNFESYTAIQLGNNLINHRVQNKNLAFKSFEDYNKYLKSLAVKKR